MKITLEIQRYDPAKDRSPRLQRFELEAESNERLLDALMRVKRTLDPSLSLRKSCGHGVCGSDALVINGKERLACKTLIKEVAAGEGAVVRIEPLRTMPLQRDLMVDQAPFFADCRKVKPFQINPALAQVKERLQTPEERMNFDDATKCILCAACYSACPVRRGKNPDFIGPAAIVQASRFIEDSRDTGFEDRLPELDQPNGIWPCENFFECTRVCPRGIKVTKLINQMKRKILEYRKSKDVP
ncbi:MAG: succinate dehydrogenase iron-sulfur subunit [Acidobacteriota bacterium]